MPSQSSNSDPNLKAVNEQLKALYLEGKALADAYIGRDVILKSGKYTGRRGFIDATTYDNFGARYLIKIYRNDSSDPNAYLWNNGLDSRTYWSIEDFTLLPKKSEKVA